jgi:hypothetical protein
MPVELGIELRQARVSDGVQASTLLDPGRQLL